MTSASVPPDVHDEHLGNGTQGAEVLTRDHAAQWEEAIEDWTTWLDAAGFTPLTLRQRRWQLRGLAIRFANRSPWKLTTDDLIGWYTSKDWGTQTRQSARSALRMFYSWAVTAGRTKRNPAAALPKIRTARGLPRPAGEDVVELALREADDRTRLMLLLAAYAGLRDVEIAGLRWSDVTDTHVIVTGKGGHARQVWQHPRLAPELTAERARREAGMTGSGYRYRRGAEVYVFPGRRGPLSPSRVCEVLSAALGPGVTGHQLRHRFATRVLDRTGDLAAVQELLGHASPATTRIYTRVSDAALRAAVYAI